MLQVRNLSRILPLMICVAIGLTLSIHLHPVSASTSGVVISQVYGAGGVIGSTYDYDFVELFNGGTTAVQLEGWTLQYTGPAGVFDTANAGLTTTLPAFLLQPGQYFLVQEGRTLQAESNSLPAPDYIDEDVPIGMSTNNGKIVLASNGVSVVDPTSANVVDFVGYGTANQFEGASPVPALGEATSAQRKLNGCTDTDDNGADFNVAAVFPNARNSASPFNPCFSPTETPTDTPTNTPTDTPTATDIPPTPTDMATDIPSTETATTEASTATATVENSTETPTATTTSEDSGTPTATDDFISTPTATETLDPVVELLKNGGMELNNDGDKLPDDWTVKKGSGERQKCDKPGKIFAHSGACAFRFKGGAKENSKLLQIPDVAGLYFRAGDQLALSVFINATNNAVKGKVKLIVKYVSGAQDKFKTEITVNQGYTELTGVVDITDPLVAKVKLLFDHKSAAGKVYIDDASVKLLRPESPLLPLP